MSLRTDTGGVLVRILGGTMLNTWRIGAVLALASILGACQLLPADSAGQAQPTGHTHITSQQLVHTYTLQDQFYVSPVLRAVEPSTRLGMMLDARGLVDLQIETQGIYEDGSVSSWIALDQVWSENLARVYRADFSRPVLGARIRVAQGSAPQFVFMDWTLTNPELPLEDESAFLQAGTNQVRQGLEGYLENLGMIDRSTWGAASSSGCGYDVSKYRTAIHHTASPAGDAGNYDQRIRQIQSYHINGNGWCDIGYHFLVTQDGQLWEGRPVSYQGAHVGGNNSGNAGITMVGCFEPGACDTSTFGPLTPSQESVDALASLIAALSAQFGFEIDASTVKGHQDHPGASTACPGENLHNRLDAIRSLAAGGVPDDQGPSDPVEPTGGAVVQGVVFDGSVTSTPSATGNLRLDGATIVSSDGESRSARESDAYWSFEVVPGSYEITASADGYESSTRTVVVVAGDSVWASIGLMPVAAEPEPDSEEEGPETDSADPTDVEQEPDSETEPEDEDETSEDTTEEEGSDDSLDSSSGSPVDSGDQSIPRDEEPSDANLPADPGLPAEDEGCSQTGSQNLLMALLGALWILRRSTRQDCPLS